MEHKVEIKSVLNDILGEIDEYNDAGTIRAIAIRRIQSSKINEKDKRTMISALHNKRSHFAVTKAIYDFILKYEGDGVINKSLGGYTFRFII
jgi:hypothetical protein